MFTFIDVFDFDTAFSRVSNNSSKITCILYTERDLHSVYLGKEKIGEFYSFNEVKSSFNGVDEVKPSFKIVISNYRYDSPKILVKVIKTIYPDSTLDINSELQNEWEDVYVNMCSRLSNIIFTYFYDDLYKK